MQTVDSKLFSLDPGSRFLLNGHQYQVVKFFSKKMPRIGKVLHCEVINESGNQQWFIFNYNVKKIEQIHA